MGLAQQVAQQFNAAINSGDVRRVMIPAGVAVAIVSDGAAAANAYAARVAIVAAAVITNPTWLGGVTILQDTLANADYADLQIGTGTVAVPLLDLAEFSFYKDVAAGAGVTQFKQSYEMRHPIYIAGAPGIVGRIRKASAASATGITPKVIFYNAVGA